MFPNIKFKDCEIHLVKRLRNDLLSLEDSILGYSPKNFSKSKLGRIRIRLFKFPKNEVCNEFFLIYGNKRYVCLNSTLLKKRYYTALQHVLHGITHHFSQFREEIGTEVFCEFVSYSLLKSLLEKKSKFFERRIIKSVMKNSPKEYNMYYRIGRKLEEKEEGFLVKVNRMVKNRKISQKKERRLFKRLLKGKVDSPNFEIKEIPELEIGFRRV